MPLLFRLALRACVVGALALVLLPAPAAAGEPPAPVTYTPPVDGPVVDGFRPPATPYGRGNRGVDYATTPGADVHAAADGVVVFAGTVGFGKHVVVQHADGIRTSYSFLADIAVRRGQRVASGDVVGHAAAQVHIGARSGDAYLDPLALFGQRRGRVHLVADDGGSAPPATARDIVDDVRRLRIAVAGDGGGDDEHARWAADEAGCTPPDQPPHPTPGRRRAVLVGGLGSATGHAAILAVDTAALGYREEDVDQFSYRADGSPYAPADTQQPIEVSAAILSDRIAAIHVADPDVPIDVFAHSQGGLVVRTALTGPGGLPGVATVVTLSSPHEGNDMAAAGVALRDDSAVGAAALAAASARSTGGIDPRSPSVTEMAVGSPFLRTLAAMAQGPPADGGVRVVSVGATSDAVVPSVRARWAGAANVTISLAGPPTPIDHGRVPGDPAATREMALAIAGQGPTCVDFEAWRARNSAGAAVVDAQRIAGAALIATAGWLDGRLPAGGPEGGDR